MTARVIRRRVDLSTGETIEREDTGETKEIAEGDYLRAMSIAVTGMSLDALCEEIKKRRAEA